MDPTTTNVEERDQWRARISRALSELQAHSDHLHPTEPAPNDSDSATDSHTLGL